MRLVLYNIRYGTGTGWKYHFPFPFYGCLRRTAERFGAISDYISGLSPDVVCLVETDSGSSRQEGKSQPALLAERLGGESVFSGKYGGSPLSKLPLVKSQGNAVASKLPVCSFREHLLSRGMKRVLLEVEFEKFSLFLMHLSLGPATRKIQIGEISAICAKSEKPAVLAGDGNIYTGLNEMAPLFSEGFSAANLSPTYPHFRPFLPLDVVFCSPGVKVRNAFVPKTDLSDHLPVVCDFDVAA